MTASKTGVELRDFEFDSAMGTYRASYDPETTPPSMAVIALLVEILDTCPIEMEQLHNTVDTDALDTVVAAASNIASAVEVSFTYEEYAVTVEREEVTAESVHNSDDSTEREVRSQ
ncbi:hypothetical protein EGH24_11835 [Halonotius terrestris]|uniref:Halobacterial output domain-containing protein n=1 Tax=Halonotius terrestris TaxID=2487750 RepID=A0A8J8TAS8_9EURY|nr:HalOD1 output domain-containing protein [Halonotius terrestris]TQQ79314.1 hypothetical protein EGH24_11835 [Halonotius terrestris]